MSNFSNQLEEIRTLISSNTKTDKSSAYSTLMHLQEQANDCPSSIQSLAESSKSLIPLVVADIDVEDEEMWVKLNYYVQSTLVTSLAEKSQEFILNKNSNARSSFFRG